MSQKDLEIRRAIMRLTFGQSAVIPTAIVPDHEAERLALDFCKAKKITIGVQHCKDGLIVTRLEPGEKISIYPELDALQVGQTHAFPFPPAMHQRVRVAATARNRIGKVRLACQRVGDQIHVTRLPITPEEISTCGPITAPDRASKYGLERLARVHELVFDFPDYIAQRRLRMAVSNKARQEGWTVRCRVSDDGKSIRVFRTDVESTSDAAA